MDLIDTHVHFLHADLFTYAMTEGNAALAGNHTLDDYRAALANGPAGMKLRSLLFIEASVLPEQKELEAELFSRLANRDRGTPPIAAVIAGAQPELPEFPQQLETLALNARIRGLRRVLSAQPDEMLQSTLLVENLRRLAETELTFDLCVRPQQLALAAALVEQCPETQFVLDHAGAPDVAGGEIEGWKTGISEMAARSNVVCKFSGLGSLSDASQSLTPQVQPYFDHCLECFFPERILWGSDWPVSSDLVAWLSTTRDLLSELQDFEQAAIGTNNANRIYRLN